ncbi:MAG: glycogen debranching protein GlgX [Succinivibrio sp.]|nr:glycogen debranching protein GlgX [Succinivibrio sp.]
MNKHLSPDVDFRLVPLGATPTKEGCYFAVWSPNARSIVIHIFNHQEKELYKVALPEKRGSIWYGFLPNVTVGDLYAIEALGENDPDRGLFFKEGRYLTDPYAKLLSKPFTYNYNEYLNNNAKFIPKCIVISNEFDWEDVPNPSFGRDGLIIYEANVKGVTKLNPLVPEKLRGKYLGLCHPSVINHFKKLGVTAIQLNPIAAFMSEPHLAKSGLVNYWGYNPINFMAPDPKYAVEYQKAVVEFKTMVKELHKHNIAVILDVVYNHTAEGGKNGCVLSLRGLDARNYYTYRSDPYGNYDFTNCYDVTGCGNTVNAQARPTLNLILDSLIYWAKHMRVDGFRFDLGVTVCRETHGSSFHEFDADGAFLKSCFCIDRLAQSIMIAEPWDVGPNGYRLGQFPQGWSEQNDQFRDTVRRFWRGDKGLIGKFATRIMGSRDIFTRDRRSINASVNYITYHDGFTLEDLVSYSHKYNEANGEENRDGTNENYSSNQGVEGPTKDPEVLKRRWLLKRNLMATTLISQGIPHLLGGDEFSHTQKGNNNVYCQDNELSWTHWDYSRENVEFINFIGRINHLRNKSKMLRELTLNGDMYHVNGISFEAKWFSIDGSPMTDDKWNNPDRDAITLTICSKNSDVDENWCLLFSQTYNERTFELPVLDVSSEWVELLDTNVPNGIPKPKGATDIKSVTVNTPCIKVYMLKKSVSINPKTYDALDSVTRHANRSGKAKKKS